MKRVLKVLRDIAIVAILGVALVAFMLWVHSTPVWEFWYGGQS